MISKKVMFLDTSLHHNNATGITFSNLFSQWPKEKLYMIGSSDQIQLSNADGYLNTYILGANEIKHRFPLELIKSFFLSSNKIKKREILDYNSIDNTISTTTTNKEERNSIKSIFNTIFNFLSKHLGLDHYFFRSVLSEDLKKWINKANPDYFYALLSTRHSIRFASDVVNEFNKPLILHIMDDWPAVIGQETIFYKKWNKVINKEFIQLVRKATKCIAISEKMAKEYHFRFGGEWNYFHNPVDIEFWGSSMKNNYALIPPFVILYSGRVSTGIDGTLRMVAESVENLIKEKGFDITFKIQSNLAPDWIDKYEHTKFNFYIDYQELPSLFSSVDLLLLPYDFSGAGFDFIRLSMPTKVPEYMISGTPILVVSPSTTALYKYATDFKWGFVISTNNKNEIKSGLKELYSNQSRREELGKIAIETAKKRHDILTVSKDFVNCFA